MFEVKQLAVGGFDDNFSYVVRDSVSGEAAVVDPCGDVSLIRAALESAAPLVPKYILLTHDHNDHTSGLAEVRSFFPAPVLVHPASKRIRSDIVLSHGMELPFGPSSVRALFTPGHSPNSICWLLGDHSAVFTGDTLFIGCCGYCRPAVMFRTMREILLPLPDEAVVYSGHDYGEVPSDTLGHQKRVNPFLTAPDLAAFRAACREL